MFLETAFGRSLRPQICSLPSRAALYYTVVLHNVFIAYCDDTAAWLSLLGCFQFYNALTALAGWGFKVVACVRSHKRCVV